MFVVKCMSRFKEIKHTRRRGFANYMLYIPSYEYYDNVEFS